MNARSLLWLFIAVVAAVAPRLCVSGGERVDGHRGGAPFISTVLACFLLCIFSQVQPFPSAISSVFFLAGMLLYYEVFPFGVLAEWRLATRVGWQLPWVQILRNSVPWLFFSGGPFSPKVSLCLFGFSLVHGFFYAAKALVEPQFGRIFSMILLGGLLPALLVYRWSLAFFSCIGIQFALLVFRCRRKGAP
ncbi:MAG: hypothetical protein LBS68_03690 [Puniceicoccales bacterium]|jgi:hypothetical protein|nr:hypothetical protein [Puniceicoccales bacterium]